MTTATEEGLVGMRRAEDRANNVIPGWSDFALSRMHAWLRKRVTPFTIEELRGDIEPLLPTPPDRRSWGGVTQTALRRGWLRTTGQMAPAKSSHGSPKPTYFSLI